MDVYAAERARACHTPAAARGSVLRAPRASTQSGGRWLLYATYRPLNGFRVTPGKDSLVGAVFFAGVLAWRASHTNKDWERY